MKKIRYGIMSTASIAPRFMRGIIESLYGEIEAVASRNEERARELADQFGVKKVYGTYMELLEDDNVDVIYMPTPNYLHYEHCMNALRHGKHVVCEKPFTLTLKQAEEVFYYAKSKGLFVMEAQKIAFLPISKWIKETIERGVIGHVDAVNLTSSFPEGEDKTHWMYSHEKGGGVFYGSASYTIEYMQYIFDEKIVSYHGTSIIGESGVDEVGTILLNMNDKHLITSTISRLAPMENIAVFYGQLGRIEVPSFWKTDTAILKLLDGTIEEIKFPFDSEFVYEIDHINECIRQNMQSSPIMTQDKTMECIKIVEDICKRR